MRLLVALGRLKLVLLRGSSRHLRRRSTMRAANVVLVLLRALMDRIRALFMPQGDEERSMDAARPLGRIRLLGKLS